MHEVFSWIGGAILGILVTRLYEQLERGPLRRLWTTAYRLVDRLSTNSLRQDVQGQYSLGRLETEWITLDASLRRPFERGRVKCHLEERAVPLPEDLAMKVKQWVEANADRHYWNGPSMQVLAIEPKRVGVAELPTIVIRFAPTDYITFKALTDAIANDTTLRETYLVPSAWERPLPVLANSFGVYLTLITRDGYIACVQRSARTISRVEWSCSVTEGMLPTDLDEAHSPDPFFTAIRGCHEELGLEHEEIRDGSLVFGNLGVNARFYQHALLGWAETTLSKRGLSSRVVGHWGQDTMLEVASIDFISLSPHDVARFVISHSPWSSGGLTCVLETLKAHSSPSRCEAAFQRVRLSARG